MSSPVSSNELLDRGFLDIRAKLLEIGASFDRIQRADGSVDDDPRMAQFRQVLEVLADPNGDDRAERIQLIFSQPYEDDWQDKFKI